MQTAYRLAMIEAVRALGIKKAMAEMLFATGLIDDSMAGNIIINVNSGGVTDITQTKKIK